MIGQTISHYKILEKLGEGGMGVVYKAHDIKLDRVVALKFLPTDAVSKEEDKKRFIQEARAAAKLSHPNICNIHAINEYEDRRFIDMEFVEGVTLREKLSSMPGEMEVIIDYAIQITEALSEAHEHEIVHRDIKPDNIMVDSRNRIKVMDFGLAKLKGAANITKQGSTVGTISYMAPEQLQGNEPDHRSDLFSFGVMFYEMLTGKSPFQGEHEAALMYSIVNEDPVPIHEFIPEASPDLIHLTSRLLEKDSDDRYQSATEILAELKRIKKKFSLGQKIQWSAASTQTPDAFNNRSKDPSTTVTINIPSLNSKGGIVFSVTVSVIVLLILFWLINGGGSANLDASPSIAVLPFESATNNPDDIQLVRGIHEDVINQLSNIEDLKVIARRSVIDFEPDNRDMSQIREELDVATFMEGTVWRMGDRIRVSAQLIDAATNQNIWAGSFDKQLEDIFELRTEIAIEISNELEASISEGEKEKLAQRPTESVEAYTYYMRAREYQSRSDYFINVEMLNAAIRLYEQALELDSNFTLAYARLAEIHFVIYWFAHDRSPERLETVEEMARKALSMEPDLPEGYYSMGLYYYGLRDYERAVNYLEKALQQLPSNPEINGQLGAAYRRLGNLEKGVKYFEKAIELDPRDPNSVYQLHFVYNNLRNYPKSLEMIEKYEQLVPERSRAIPKAFIYLNWKGTLDSLSVLYEPDSENRLEQEGYWWWYLNANKGNWDKALQAALNFNNLLEFQTVVFPKEMFIGLSYEQLDSLDLAYTYYKDAISVMEALKDENPDHERIHAGLGFTYSFAGKKESAIREGKKATELVPIERDAAHGDEYEIYLAQIYTQVEEHEKALKIIEKLLSVPSSLHKGLLEVEFWWDPLRDHPRFKQLIED